MPTIVPFSAFRPAASLQGLVATRPLEDYSMGEARLMASENPYTFLHLINPELDHPYLRGSRQELVYKKIAENFEQFTEQQILCREAQPAMYIYQVHDEGLTQTGLWTLTHINAYLDGEVKKHEHTVERREKLLAEYLQQTGLDANPVLMTYPPDAAVDALIGRYTAKVPDVQFRYRDGTEHRLWKLIADNDIALIRAAFAAMPAVYLADGHHRVASMAKMALRMRAVNTDPEAAFNYFSTAYFSTQEVKIRAFNRLLRDLGDWQPQAFLRALAPVFEIEKADAPVEPLALHHFGMYLDNTWYRLRARPSAYNPVDPVGLLDVSILQEKVLGPLLGVHDPRTDARITFEGGKTPISQLQFQVDSGNAALAFTLFPTTVEQVMAVADANAVMPPKSTWVAPKFLVGLLTHYFG